MYYVLHETFNAKICFDKLLKPAKKQAIDKMHLCSYSKYASQTLTQPHNS